MPILSKEKKEKIQEQILYVLFNIFPKQIFTSYISKEIARDEEFTKLLLIDLEKKELVVNIDKNENGIKYKKRKRWRLSNKTFEVYNQKQKLFPTL
jgi:predicted transcriptional regulator with HTH domain